MKIFVLALDGVFDSGLAVLLDALGFAHKFAAAQTGRALSFEVSIVSVRKKVKSGHGLAIPVNRISPDSIPDWVIVPALNTGTPETLIPALGRRDVFEAMQHLQKWHAQGARIGASCIGTFLLAESGLLDNGEATTTWWLAPLFRQRYPSILLDETRMVVPSRSIVTAGAAMGHLDLALWVIRQASPELAALVGRYLLADFRSSQAPYIIPNHLARSDAVIQHFERWARDHLKEGFSLEEAAKALATSPRTLQRRCQAVLGKSPLSYFQDLRVERARSLVHGSELDLDSIAAEVGYVDGTTLGTLLRQRLGRGMRELRADLR